MNQTLFTIKENDTVSGPLVNIFVPDGLHVTLGPSSTPYAFRIEGKELFLNVTPDYEVQSVGWMECAFIGTYTGGPLNLGKLQRRRG